MLILLSTIVTASLLGSMHCVGMCGPLAIWASGAGDQNSRRSVVMANCLYHAGRLVTYLLAGLIAGVIGSAVDVGGSWIGLQVAAARVVGAVMIGVGLWKLWFLTHPAEVRGDVRPSMIGSTLVRLRPYLFRLPLAGRAFGTGLLTTLLPCGWLYLFALIAAGTGSLTMGPMVMFAFWIGTVPALTSLVVGTRLLTQRFSFSVSAAASILLILAGGYTASGRGFAELTSLDSLRPAATSERGLVKAAGDASETKLPCCQE